MTKKQDLAYLWRAHRQNVAPGKLIVTFYISLPSGRRIHVAFIRERQFRQLAAVAIPLTAGAAPTDPQPDPFIDPLCPTDYFSIRRFLAKQCQVQHVFGISLQAEGRRLC